MLGEAYNPAVDAANVELFFSLYFGMTGLHALHMVIGLGAVAVVCAVARTGAIRTPITRPSKLPGCIGILWTSFGCSYFPCCIWFDDAMSRHVVSVMTYVGVYFGLLLLLAVSVAAVLVEHSAVALSLALAIAGLKATLIALYFMHLRHDTPPVRLAAFAGFVWLSILIGLSMSDVLTRAWAPATETPAIETTSGPGTVSLQPQADGGSASGDGGAARQMRIAACESV